MQFQKAGKCRQLRREHRRQIVHGCRAVSVKQEVGKSWHHIKTSLVEFKFLLRIFFFTNLYSRSSRNLIYKQLEGRCCSKCRSLRWGHVWSSTEVQQMNRNHFDGSLPYCARGHFSKTHLEELDEWFWIHEEKACAVEHTFQSITQTSPVRLLGREVQF